MLAGAAPQYDQFERAMSGAFGVSRTMPMRPQTPTVPFPYVVQDTRFDAHQPGRTLAGTLTRPEAAGRVPGVVFLWGSGAHDRDETIFEHKPFLVLADALTRHGYATLRYDHPGIGGSNGEAAAVTFEGRVADARCAVRHLASQPGIDRVILVGHSEGALVAFALACDEPVAGIVALAGPGVPLETLLHMQAEATARIQGFPEEQIAAVRRVNAASYALVRAFDAGTLGREDAGAQIEALLRAHLQAWPSKATSDASPAEAEEHARTWAAGMSQAVLSGPFASLLRQEPARYLSVLRCPMLVLVGDLDRQVEPTANLAAIEEAIAPHRHALTEVHRLPGINHLLQTAQTGWFDEYATIEETVAPSVQALIRDWLDRLKNLSPSSEQRGAVPTASARSVSWRAG